MKEKYFYLILLFFSSLSYSQKNDFKVVGYLPGYRTSVVDTSVGKYLDDLIYFNLRVDSSANLTREVISEEGLELVAQIKQKYGVRTQICIAGWWTTEGKAFAHVIPNDSLRAIFVQNVLNFCLDNDFDGVDYDWEHPQNDKEIEAYIDLFRETKEVFEPHDMIVSAATSKNLIFPKEAYEILDKIHLMTYTNFRDDTESVLKYLDANIPKEKLYIGTPFFGRDTEVKAYTYKDLIETYDMAPEFDNYNGISYEGIFTQERKIFFSNKHDLAGMMIWEVGQDSPDHKSLLKSIHNAVKYVNKIQPPGMVMVTPSDEQSIKIEYLPISDVSGIRIRFGSDYENFSDSITVSENPAVISNLHNDSLYYFQLVGIGKNSELGIPSKILAATPNVVGEHVLIVNNYHAWRKPLNLVSSHSELLHKRGFGISSVYGDSIAENYENEITYNFIDWIEGDNGYQNTSLTESHKTFIANYLEKGGNLFISGSNVGFDLYIKNNITENKIFSLTYLRSITKEDVPDDIFSQRYSLQAVSGSIFDGIGEINFDDGSHGTYNVFNPDVLYNKTYSSSGLDFADYTGARNSACNYYSGIFGNGEIAGKMVFLSIPVETIYPEEKRNLVFEKILDWFDQTTAVDTEQRTPADFRLLTNYPNPFNPSTTISYTIPQNNVIPSEAKNLQDFSSQTPQNDSKQVELKIYDVLGRKIRTLVNKVQKSGTYKVLWNGTDDFGKEISSGFYFCRLFSAEHKLINKMILMR